MTAQSPSKPSARQIRRAFGPQALFVLDQHAAAIDEIQKAFVRMEQDILPRIQALEQPKPSFWQRIKAVLL